MWISVFNDKNLQNRKKYWHLGEKIFIFAGNKRKKIVEIMY